MYLEEAGYETAYIGKWHLASHGEMDQPPVIDHTVTAIPAEYRSGYTGYWRAADVLEFTSHSYDDYVFDENNRRVDFRGYRADCINDMALDFFDRDTGEKPFFMTVSQIEPHHQNDRRHYGGPDGSREKYADFILPHDLAVLGGNAAEEYPDYLGQCASPDKNLGRLIAKLKERGLYDSTIILYASDHGSHFQTRNRDAHLRGGDGSRDAAAQVYADDYLYDLAADPYQLHNIVEEPGWEAVKAALRAQLLDWILSPKRGLLQNLHFTTGPMKFVLGTNEIRPQRVKSGPCPDEIAPMGRLWCPFGTNGIFLGGVAKFFCNTPP